MHFTCTCQHALLVQVAHLHMVGRSTVMVPVLLAMGPSFGGVLPTEHWQRDSACLCSTCTDSPGCGAGSCGLVAELAVYGL